MWKIILESITLSCYIHTSIQYLMFLITFFTTGFLKNIISCYTPILCINVSNEIWLVGWIMTHSLKCLVAPSCIYVAENVCSIQLQGNKNDIYESKREGCRKNDHCVGRVGQSGIAQEGHIQVAGKDHQPQSICHQNTHNI